MQEILLPITFLKRYAHLINYCKQVTINNETLNITNNKVSPYTSYPRFSHRNFHIPRDIIREFMD